MIPDLRTDLRRLEPFLDCQCESWRRCSRTEHAELLRTWQRLFPSGLLAYARGKRGANAFAEQAKLGQSHFFVVQTHDPAIPPKTSGDIAYEVWAGSIPDFTGLSHHIDFFVSPPDLSWTVIYTHEVDVFGGPFFTRREWVVPPSPAHDQRRRRHERGLL